MSIDQTIIRTLIPHAKGMCLLESVEDWDEDWVVCLSSTHRREDNPLRRNGELSVVHAMEYGAQAMAVHGGLLAKKNNQSIAPGYLVALRNAQFFVPRLDTLDDGLRVKAICIMSGPGSLMYEFELSAGGAKVAVARATVMT